MKVGKTILREMTDSELKNYAGELEIRCKKLEKMIASLEEDRGRLIAAKNVIYDLVRRNGLKDPMELTEELIDKAMREVKER